MGGHPINVLLVGPVHTASFNIGVVQPMNYLRQQGLVEFKARREQNVSRGSIERSDVVVFSRTAKPKSYELMKYAQRKNKRTVYVIDDHFLAMPVTSAMGKRFNDKSVRRTYMNFLRHAHVVKVASPFFATHLKKHYHPRKVICFPGSVNFALVDQLTKSERGDNKIVIGYAGGNKSKAFIPVIRALKRVLRKCGDRVEVQFFGYIPPELKGYPNVVQHNYEYDYKTYLCRLYEMNWDIGIAPLENALHHDCKTDNKFREYSACYIPGIYSSTPVYKPVVIDGETGLLVDHHVDAWYKALRQLIEQPELRRKIGLNAATQARKLYTIEDCAQQWLEKILKS